MVKTRVILATVLFTALFGSAYAATDDARTVAVSGRGSAVVAPDIAIINMSIIKRAVALRDARQAAGEATNRVLNRLAQLNIERKYINTTGALIRPEYKWDKASAEQQLTGYVVERRIRTELRDLEKLGVLIEQVADAGVNQLSPPQLDSSRRREIYRQALTRAYQDARANAETLAVAADETLGKVLSLNSSNLPAAPLPRARMQAEAMATSSTAESYMPGEIRFDATVSVVYALDGK